VSGVTAADLLGLLVRGFEVLAESIRRGVLGNVLVLFLLVLIVEHVAPGVGCTES
jgi:hypothetical protein